jgi:hypothetical protein
MVGLLVSKKAQQILAFIFGVVFVVVLLVVSFSVPNPTPFQFIVFKVVLALAVAGVAAMIPGFIEFNIPTYVRAGGALAVFAIVFFKNPATLVIQKVDPDFISVSTDSDQPLNVIIDIVQQKQNVTIVFDSGCGSSIPKTQLQKGTYDGKNVQDFLEQLRQRAYGKEPAYHVVKEGNQRYEIVCP